MISFIPPLDFSRSPSSFKPAVVETTAPTLIHQDPHEWDDRSKDPPLASRQTPVGARRSPKAADDEVEGTETVIKRHSAWETIDKKEDKCESEEVDLIPTLTKSPTSQIVSVGSQCTPTKKLVKRRLTGSSEKGGGEEWTSFRCDINVDAASRGTFGSAEAKAKHLVLTSGGKLIEDFVYPGGFLYQIPIDVVNPLQDDQDTAAGIRLSVSPWQLFPSPRFNGLKMTPYGGAAECLEPSRRPRSLCWSPKVSYNDRTKWRVTAWVDELVRNHGNGVPHMA